MPYWRVPGYGGRSSTRGINIDTTPLSVIVAAAQHLVAGVPASRYCTWKTTRWDDEFDLPTTLRYLRAESDNPDELLLQQYADLHKQHEPIELAGIHTLAPWIDSLEHDFIDYSSFRLTRENMTYSTIATFTTPAVSESNDQAFLEVWTEDGRYAQMGFWWWLQLRFTRTGWIVEWENMHSIS
ncbi:MAG: hypothetical protein ACKO3V_13180 [Pirellula sp.]